MIAGIVLGLSLCFMAVTWITAWWGVIVLALVLGACWRRNRAAEWCAMAASLGWALLIVLDATEGRMGSVMHTVGGVMRLPGIALVVVTLLFAAAAAWSAAAIGSELAGRLRHARASQRLASDRTAA